MKLFLAGLSWNIYSENLMFESHSNLESYFFLSKKNNFFIRKHIELKGQDNFILDSGAFSMFSGKAKMNFDSLKKYVDSYCDFINTFNIKNFIELDIDSVIGYEDVKKINKYIENKVGRRPLYVHHTQTRTYEDLLNEIKQTDFVCLGGLVKEKNDHSFLQSFINVAFDGGCKTHLLGFTPGSLDQFKNLYSCDSSSWTMGCRNNVLYSFENNKLNTIIVKDKNRIGHLYLNNYNLKQWIKYQQYLKQFGWKTE